MTMIDFLDILFNSLFIRRCIVCACLLGVTGSECTPPPVKAYPLQVKIIIILLLFI
jgi:hypothetical protein